jgi:hypothetical protein
MRPRGSSVPWKAKGGVRGVLALLIIVTGKPASGTFLGWRRCLILQARQRSDITSFFNHSRELTTPVQLLCMRRESENMPRAPSTPATKDLTPEERRKRRALRREKQREHNILRAAKMHKARLRPHLKAETSRDLKETVYVDCSGWRCWKWRDSFYATVPQAEWFRHYSGTFDTVEINPSFYSWPTVAGVQAYASTSRISSSSRAPKRSLGMIADILGEPMGACSSSSRQLPLHQSPSEFDRKPARPGAA